jgi:hypothetical protein
VAASLYLNQTPPSPAWLSPALSVVKSVGLINQDAGTPLLDVDPNVDSQSVRGVAGNDGADPANDVHVQLWAYAFATAPASSLYLTSLGGVGGVSIPAGAGVTVGSMQAQPFETPWDSGSGLTSTDPEIAALLNADGELHCCVRGNVHSPADGQLVTDPATLDVAGNRRHAQRNMTIKPHDASAALAFMLFAGNDDRDRDRDVRLQVAERTPRELAGWELAELDALGPWIRRTRRAPEGGLPGIEIVIDRKRHPVRAGRRPLKDLGIDVSDAGDGREVKLELGADEARKLHIHADLPDQEFVLRIFDVAQLEGKRTVGGARLMTLTVPDELLKPRAKSA